MSNHKDTQGNDVKKTTASEWAKNERIYTEINKEVEVLVSPRDRIVFGPAEDFEDTTPLEDFMKSLKNKTV